MNSKKDVASELFERFNGLPDHLQSLSCELIKALTEAYILPQLVEQYLKTAKEVREDKKKSPGARREKLKKLLTCVHFINKAASISSPLALPDGESIFPCTDYLDAENEWNLYKDAAAGISCKMAGERGLLDDKEAITEESLMLLKLIVSGFHPECLFQSLLNDKRNKYSPIPLSIENFYVWYFSEHIPRRIQNKRAGKHEKQKEAAAERRVTEFNRYSSRPVKGADLAVWLFGAEGSSLSGRYCQWLDETVLNRYARRMTHDA